MSYMKKLLAFVGVCLVSILFVAPESVYAYTPEIYSVDIYIELNQDGSADVTETWDVQVADGTEWYLAQGNLGKIEIQDFSVMDETGTVYENEGYWDVDRSIEEKAGKCGIVDKGNGSYELCWGVGSYGDHVFTVNYHMTDFVKGFDDYCGFNQRVINDELSSPPQRILVTVTKPGTEFTTDDVGVWAFGFEGFIYIENGLVSATSNSSLGSNDYVTVMCRFPREMFDTTNIVGGSFDEMLDRALEGSDYDQENRDTGDIFVIGMVVLFIVVFIVLLVYMSRVAKKNSRVTTFEEAREYLSHQKHVKFYAKPAFWVVLILSTFLNPLFPVIIFIWTLFSSRKDGDEVSESLMGKAYPTAYVMNEKKTITDYSREVPFLCHISAVSAASSMMCLNEGKNHVIGAYLLKWLQSGDVEIRQERKEGLGGALGAEAPSVVLRNIPENLENHTERRLFNLLVEASGGDNILQEKEMYRWARSNHAEVNSMMQEIEAAGKLYMTDHLYLGKIPSSGMLGFSLVSQEAFTESGRAEIINLYQFKNFLKDFTLINERQPEEVTLWDQYLIVAQIFGMADAIAEQFRAIYPDYFTNHAVYYSDYAGSYAVINAISNAGISGASAGSGGSSSSGGGGGSSGGGSGGGSR